MPQPLNLMLIFLLGRPPRGFSTASTDITDMRLKKGGRKHVNLRKKHLLSLYQPLGFLLVH
jgi:hypothetical protein